MLPRCGKEGVDGNGMAGIAVEEPPIVGAINVTDVIRRTIDEPSFIGVLGHYLDDDNSFADKFRRCAFGLCRLFGLARTL